MSELQYTTVDRILSKVNRDLKGVELNESDAIEWMGEALEFLKVPQIQQQAVAFIEVKDYEATLPTGFQMVLQLAKHNTWTPKTKQDCVIPPEVVEEINEQSCDEPELEPVNCSKTPLLTEYCPKYIPYFDMQWQYIPWTAHSYCKENFSPIRLANNTFFGNIVCKEKDQTPYINNMKDEYTIVGSVEKKLRVSFREGYVALSYIKNAIDEVTGYPLIPDNISYLTAITYYIKWKVAQMYEWNGREGYTRLAQDSERLWLKYAKQAKNYMKMPKSLDQFQNLLEQSHYLIPRHKRYYNYFGNLGRAENRVFNNPGYRNNY